MKPSAIRLSGIQVFSSLPGTSMEAFSITQSLQRPLRREIRRQPTAITSMVLRLSNTDRGFPRLSSLPGFRRTRSTTVFTTIHPSLRPSKNCMEWRPYKRYDAAANTLFPLFSLAAPRSDAPATLPSPPSFNSKRRCRSCRIRADLQATIAIGSDQAARFCQ